MITFTYNVQIHKTIETESSFVGMGIKMESDYYK